MGIQIYENMLKGIVTSDSWRSHHRPDGGTKCKMHERNIVLRRLDIKGEIINEWLMRWNNLKDKMEWTRHLKPNIRDWRWLIQSFGTARKKTLPSIQYSSVKDGETREEKSKR